jgi:hypothetical protein
MIDACALWWSRFWVAALFALPAATGANEVPKHVSLISIFNRRMEAARAALQGVQAESFSAATGIFARHAGRPRVRFILEQEICPIMTGPATAN